MKVVEENEYIKNIIGDIQKGEDFIVLDRKGKYLGIIPNDRLIKYAFKPDMKIKNIYIKIKPAKSLDLYEIAKRMLSANIRVYPIQVNKDVELISIFDLLQKVAEREPNIFNIKVEEIMSKNLITINEKESALKALALMKNKGVSRLVVVDDKGNIAGILSLSDIIRAFLTEKERASFGEISEEKLDVEIRSFLSDRVIFINKDDNLLKAIDVMNKYKIYALPVLEGSRPIGIITAKDILAYYIAYKEKVTYPIVVHGISIDEIDRKYIEDKFKSLVRKYEKYIGENPMLIMHIKKIREVKEDKMAFFSIKARLISNQVKLYANRDGEEFYSAINAIFHIFREELEKRKYENIKKYYIEKLFKEGLEYI